MSSLGQTGFWHATAVRRAQDATADGWRILEDYRIFLTSRSQEATAATEAVRNRWRNEARHCAGALLGFHWHRKTRSVANLLSCVRKQLRAFCQAASACMASVGTWSLFISFLRGCAL